jgi:signal transduction histidine kinase
MMPLAREKQIRIEYQIYPPIDAVLDGARFKQILYNYLSNALKFTPEGGRVAVKARLEGSDEFSLEVTDSGAGISDADIGGLFTDFHQLDSGKSKRFQGAGLGLALTRRLVEMQGGRVGVRSTLGQGSTFFAVLPRAIMKDADHEARIDSDCR